MISISVIFIAGELMQPVKPDNMDSLIVMPLDKLMGHIQIHYHDFSREILEKLENLPDVAEFRHEIAGFRENFEFHLMKEEKVLFPFIRAILKKMEEPEFEYAGQFPPTVAFPVKMMLAEHESHLEELGEMQQLLSQFSGSEPERLFQQFTKNLLNHIYIENNLLFPASIKMEETLHKNHG